jgi:hypothetical protein
MSWLSRECWIASAALRRPLADKWLTSREARTKLVVETQPWGVAANLPRGGWKYVTKNIAAVIEAASEGIMPQ